MSKQYHAEVTQVKAVARQIMPLLAGTGVNVQGGVLGELVGMYFAGHNPEIRPEIRKAFDDMVNAVIKIMDESPDAPWRPQ